MTKRFLLSFVFLFSAFANSAFADAVNSPNLIETISRNSYLAVAIGGGLILLLVIIASINKTPIESFKIFIFFLITIISLIVTFYLAGATIYINNKSITGGPVHWHADFKIYSCGKELRLTPPTGFSNRIGRTDLHEHGDKRIHVEGVVVEKQDVSLHEFFRVIGGFLEYGKLTFPGSEKKESLIDGNLCTDGKEGKLQVFLYKTEGKEIKQIKLVDYLDYVLSPHSQIPPGDCIIFEFTPDIKDTTDLICDFTKISIDKGNYKYIKSI